MDSVLQRAAWLRLPLPCFLMLAICLTGATAPQGCGETDADGDGYTTTDGDCDDNDADTYPDAPEQCDDVDNDCDGQVDDGLALYYPDRDGDGYGDASATGSCTGQPGYLTDDGDCDDTDPLVNPGSEEICNGQDDNCDGTIDAGETDETEPNNSLETATDLGDLNGDTTVVTSTWTGTIASAEDGSDFYHFTVADDFTLGTDGFFIDATLSGIPADADYDLHLWWDDPEDAYFPGIQEVAASQTVGNADETLRHEGDSGPENGGEYWLEVRQVTGSGCTTPYTIVMENMG